MLHLGGFSLAYPLDYTPPGVKAVGVVYAMTLAYHLGIRVHVEPTKSYGIGITAQSFVPALYRTTANIAVKAAGSGATFETDWPLEPGLLSKDIWTYPPALRRF